MNDIVLQKLNIRRQGCDCIDIRPVDIVRLGKVKEI